MEWLSIKQLGNSLLYSLLGIFLFVVVFIIVDKLTPVNLWREITQEKNIAVAILAAAVALGMALIIAAAIHG